MAKQEFYIRGTSCKSCEVVIERQLIKQEDVLAVDVSHAKQCLYLETEGDRSYTREEVNAILRPHDYSVGKPEKHRKRQRVDWKRIGAALILAIGLYLMLDATGLLQVSPSASQPASLWGVLIIGLIASLSSCTAVVGGLVAAVSGAVAKTQETLTPTERLRPHLFFNAGRIGGFFLLGALIGLFGSALQLSPVFNGLFMVVVALMMVLIGINLMELLPVSGLGMPKWLSHKVHDLAESRNPFAPMLLGAATFVLPCGFTQSMQLLALSLQDPWLSGLTMMLFALGTTPVLLGIGGMTSYAKGKTLKWVIQGAGLVVLVLGFANITNGLTLLGVNPDTVFGSPSAEAGEQAIVSGERQSVHMDVTSWGSYEPNIITVTEGIPVDWNITGADFMGCADTLILPAFGVSERLRSGSNLVQFTPTKAGSYTFSCSMGMIRGTMIVTPAA